MDERWYISREMEISFAGTSGSSGAVFVDISRVQVTMPAKSVMSTNSKILFKCILPSWFLMDVFLIAVNAMERR